MCGNSEEDVIESSSDLFKKNVHIAFQCLKDVIIRHRMLLYFVKDMQLLEMVSVTDCERRGKVCLSGGKVGEVREWIRLAADGVKPEMNRIEVPVTVSHCYVPELNLPVSGCVMKGVTFVAMKMNNFEGGNGNGNGNDGFVNGDDDRFENKEEAAYDEAVTEILENYKDRMTRLL